ncbi:uncharacterized protein LOC130759608 isoform X2 [Actinidia eriantha]|uniref:uncharacterized protein LOC130759608 isoform X2 n=1 Tax=Actinidia eriantha TaxID=165200 RepID=UPI002586608E|nr:uncharacterized protein LOC130759608 isoform X2 [Actinidia eriantha]
MVREFVREVIQENRVLGPAKLAVEEQSRDRFLEQYLLGSISIEPETDSLSSNGSPIHILPNHHQDTNEELVSNSSGQSLEPEQRFDEGQSINGSGTDLSSSNGCPITTHILPNHQQDTSEELVSNSRVQCPEPEQRFDEGQSINGSGQAVEKNREYDTAIHTELRARESVELEKKLTDVEESRAKVTHVAAGRTINGSGQAVEKNEEYDKALYTEFQAGERVESEENLADVEASRAKVTHVAADTMVETFPLTSASRTSYGLDVKYSESNGLTGTWVEKEIGKVETEASNNDSVADGIKLPESSSDVGNGKAVAKPAVPLLKKSRGLADEKPVGNLQAPLLENSNDSATKGGPILETNYSTDYEVKNASPARINAAFALDGMVAQSLDGTTTSGSCEKSIPT